ncbi:MAG: hypothetical protein ACK45H_13825 [Bacteroidota bacterium]|jgi:hypothetical protein
MKAIALFTLVLLGNCHFSTAQNLVHSNKIIEAYGQEWFDRNATANPGILSLMDTYIAQGFFLEVIEDEKYTSFQSLDRIPLRSKSEEFISIEDFIDSYSSNDFNPLLYGFFPINSVQIFKLEGHNKIIRIQPQSTLINN